MADHFERQRVLSEDLVAHDVGHRHFGGRNQVQRLGIRAQDLEQVGLEFRQLSGTGHACSVDQIWRVDFGVAVLFGMHIEHELRERAVQFGEPALHQREACAGDLGRSGKIKLPKRLAQIDVILDRKIKTARRPPAMNFDVVGLRLANRDAFLRHVRNDRDESVELLEQFTEPHFVGFELALHRSDFGHHGGSVFTLALEHADLLRQAVTARLQILRARLQRLSLSLQPLESRRIERIAARSQPLGNGIDVVTQQLNIEHFQSLNGS